MARFISEDHRKIFLKWETLNESVKGMVENTYLYKYASYIKNRQVPTRHLQALCNSYDPEDSSFTVNGHRIYLGLQDVFYITGLPIVGDQVVFSEQGAKQEFEERFGTRIEKGNSIKLTYLLKFQRVDQDCNEDDLLRHAQAYLLFIIGCLILPGWRRDEVPCTFYRAVKHLDRVNKFAWGAATLAYTHSALKSRHNDARCGFFPGNTLLLLIYSIVHIPELAQYFELSAADKFPVEFPLMRVWEEIMQVHSSNKHREMEITEQMSVVNCPYSRVNVPDERKGELTIIYVENDFFCQNHAWTYRPTRFACHISDLDETMPTDLTPIHSVVTRKKNGLAGHDWAKEYSPFLRQWNQRQQKFIAEPVNLDQQLINEEESPASTATENNDGSPNKGCSDSSENNDEEVNQKEAENSEEEAPVANTNAVPKPVIEPRRSSRLAEIRKRI